MPGTLFVVATPIGNRADLSPRASDTLRAADLVYAEDTRTARRLLSELGIDKPTRSCFDANEAARAAEITAALTAGKNVALVSEAGTPGISDPGFRVVRAAIDAGARVVPVPGPSAILAALVASGLPSDHFVFVGFPPRKGSARAKLVASLRALPWTIVLYESPVRTFDTLVDLAGALGHERPAVVAREITKTHEELARGTLGDLADRYRDARPLGEVTIVVGGARDDVGNATDAELESRAQAMLAAGRTARDVAAQLASDTRRPKRDVYNLVTRLRSPQSPTR